MLMFFCHAGLSRSITKHIQHAASFSLPTPHFPFNRSYVLHCPPIQLLLHLLHRATTTPLNSSTSSLPRFLPSLTQTNSLPSLTLSQFSTINTRPQLCIPFNCKFSNSNSSNGNSNSNYRVNICNNNDNILALLQRGTKR